VVKKERTVTTRGKRAGGRGKRYIFSKSCDEESKSVPSGRRGKRRPDRTARISVLLQQGRGPGRKESACLGGEEKKVGKKGAGRGRDI